MISSCTRTIIVSSDTAPGTPHKAIVVRLATQSRKIDFLRSELSKSNISQSHSQRLQAQLDNAVNDDKAYLAYVKEAFDKHFSWSRVYYVPDSLFKSFRAGVKNVCLGQNNIPDPDLAPPDDYLLVTALDPREKLILTDRDGIRLSQPYPYRKNIIFPAFRRIINKRKFIESQVTYLNEKLFQANP